MKDDMLDVHFFLQVEEKDMPTDFCIITAYNPVISKFEDEFSQTSLVDIEKQNKRANNSLEEQISQLPCQWSKVSIGSTTKMIGIEAGFYSSARLHTIVDISKEHKQFAVYSVQNDELSIVYNFKDSDNMVLMSGSFSSRVLKFGCKDLHH